MVNWIMLRTRLLLIAATLLCYAMLASPARSHTFLAIAGAELGLAGSEASGISDNGEVVVGRASIDADSKAFVWDATNGIEFINDAMVAWGVSGDGRVVVGQSIPQDTGWSEPFRWTRAGGINVLGGPAGSELDSFSFADAASYDGSVIVGSTLLDGRHTAFRWTQQNGFEFLGNGSSIAGSALGVSADGQVIAGYEASDSQAFRWTLQDGKTPISSAGLGGNSTAVDVSANGSVVVGNISGSISFRWTTEQGMIPLGPSALPGSHTINPLFSYALATTNAGEAVVGSGNGTIAYVWTEQFGMESLALVLANRFGLGSALAGWQLEEATDISPDGRAIVGKGRSPSGQTQAWLARLDRPIFVPEPCSAGIAAVALGLLARAYRRRRDLARE
jgi:uncharacterized membrane protein